MGVILYPNNVLDSFYYDGSDESEQQSKKWTTSKFYPLEDKAAPSFMPDPLPIRAGDTLVELDMNGFRVISIVRNGQLIPWS